MSPLRWAVLLAVLGAMLFAWLTPGDVIPWTGFDPTVPVPQ